MIKLVRMLFIFVGFLGLASNSFAADVTMRISIQLPMKSHLGQNLLLFKNDVEKKSNGEIEVQIYDSAQLYKDKEVPAAVGSGSIESGVASFGTSRDHRGSKMQKNAGFYRLSGTSPIQNAKNDGFY